MNIRNSGNYFSLSLFLMVFMLFFAPAVLWPGSASAASAKGELAMGVETIRGFDAIKTVNTISTSIAANAIMEPLFYSDEKGKQTPALGLSATPSADGKAWTIALREGVTFHDGVPFDADAVIAHWSRMLDPKNRFRRRIYITPVLGVEKVDSHTVRFMLKHPWAPFKTILSWNRSFIALIPSPKAVAEDVQNSAPVGTGPFRFVEWKRSESVVVEKNADYWNAGQPVADRVVFRILPDHQTRYAALQAGEMDLIYTDRGSHIVNAQKDDSLKVWSEEDNGAEIILINNAKPPLDDVRVRKALLHAWSQEHYISISYKDTIPMIEHAFGSGLACADVAYPQFDPEAARALLAEYGKPVKIEYLHTNSQRGRDAGQILQQRCKAVGIDLVLAPMDIGPIVKKVFTGDYQTSSWRTPSAPDLGPVQFSRYHSKSRANLSRYASPEMDDLLVRQRMETDPETRRALFCQVAAKVNSEAVIMFRGGRRYHFIAVDTLAAPHAIIQGVPLFHMVSPVK